MAGQANGQDTIMGGLPDFDQKLLASFHSAPDHVKSAICTILQIGSAEGEQRLEPLSLAQDMGGIYFADSMKDPRDGVSPVVPEHHRDPWANNSILNLPVVPVQADTPLMSCNASRATAGTSTSSWAYQGLAANPTGRALPIATRRPGPAATSSPIKRTLSDDEDGEIKEGGEDAAAAYKSTEGREAEEEAEHSRFAPPARRIISGVSAAISEAARSQTGLYGLDDAKGDEEKEDDEEDEEGGEYEKSWPTLPSRGYFSGMSMVDSEAIRAQFPRYSLKDDSEDEEEGAEG